MAKETLSRRPNFETFFRDADVDKDGYLTFQEVTDIFKKYGYKCEEQEIKAFFKMADTSGDNKISFDEYMEVMLDKNTEYLHDEAVMRRVFALFDRDSNGVIDKSELQAVFAEMGRHFSEAEVNQLMSLTDTDGNQTLDYEEFIQAAKQGKFGAPTGAATAP